MLELSPAEECDEQHDVAIVRGIRGNKDQREMDDSAAGNLAQQARDKTAPQEEIEHDDR
jgi:hypothetical protein